MDFVEMFAYQSLRKLHCHSDVIDIVLSKKRSWEYNAIPEVIHEDNEVPGTQLEENPKYVPPSHLRELLYDQKENDLRT